MNLARSVPAILHTDLLRLLRDRFLLGAAAYIVGIAVALRWVIPLVADEVMQSSGFDLAPYLPMGVSYFILVNASVVTGLVGGFLLLELREEQTVRALLVSPTPLSVHVLTMSGLILLTGTSLALLETAIVGVGVPPWDAAVVAAILSAPSGIVMALMLVVLAQNKVEAFAVMKITAVMGLVPAAAWFVPEPWQQLAGAVPPYWGCKIWWMATEGEPWTGYVLPGIGVTALWIAVLSNRFRRVARR